MKEVVESVTIGEKDSVNCSRGNIISIKLWILLFIVCAITHSYE
jgi:hypothetical protein